MSINNAVSNYTSLLSTIGKVALNTKYPLEFELYMCAFELVDQNNNTLQYFIFPIMPSSLDETEPESTTIKRTLAGITALSTTTFTPIDIALSGNFGRKFKILLGVNYIDSINAFKSDGGQIAYDDRNSTAQQVVFDARIKTGYGCLQVLKDILEQSNVVDSNGCRRLIFYNLAFGTSYVVKVMSKKINMTQDSNMIHNYFVSLKAIAPLDALKTQNELDTDAARLNTNNFMQTQANKILNTLTAIV